MVCPRRGHSLVTRDYRRGEDTGVHKNGVDWDVDGVLHEGRDCCSGEVRGGRPGHLIETLVFFHP